MTETKKDAVAALETFVETYQINYQRAANCLTKDRDSLLAFYDFPAEHWTHLRTTNPIESTSSRSPAVRAWPWCVGSSASCSGCWRSCAPSSVARGLSATPHRAPSRTRARHRRREGRLGDRNLRRRCQTATLQIEQQITPRL